MSPFPTGGGESVTGGARFDPVVVEGATTDPAYGTARISSETRPTNANVQFIIQYQGAE